MVQADNPGGIFTSLGVGELLSTDSLSFGRITSENKIAFDQDTKYVAIGLAPLVPDKIDIFVPEAFSPSATDPRNQTFRIFGTGVEEEGFRMVVVNQFNKVIYETTSFQEAKTIGWDGGDEPAGLYYYVIDLVRTDGELVKLKNPFYLVR